MITNYQELLDLVYVEKNQLLQEIINADPSVLQLSDHRGQGILLVCMELRNSDMVDFLIKHHRSAVQYELDKKNADGFSVLYIPVIKSDFKTIDLLINECDMDPAERNDAGESLLEIAENANLLSRLALSSHLKKGPKH